MKRTSALAAVAAAVLALTSACAFGPPGADEQGTSPNLPPPSAPSRDPGGSDDDESQVAITVLAKKLEIPWGIAFLPAGGALVTERDTARILQVGPDTDKDGLKVTEVQRLNEVQSSGDGGLLGIAVSPKYATDKTLFVYYSTAKDNRIGKLVLGGKLQPILTGIPRSVNDNGGALAFGPDGYLYAGTGDGTPTGTQAQNTKSLAGKILRITTDGKPAPGNPALGTPAKASAVWASGFRNVQGVAWDKAKKMYATDNDHKKSGELNIIAKGKDYGWPKVDGSGGEPQFADPMLEWPMADSSCAGVATADNTVATACLLGKRIWLANVTGTGTVLGNTQPVLADKYGRLRGLATAPDGSFWVTTSNQEDAGDPKPDDDQILRLVFTDGAAGKS